MIIFGPGWEHFLVGLLMVLLGSILGGILCGVSVWFFRRWMHRRKSQKPATIYADSPSNVTSVAESLAQQRAQSLWCVLYPVTVNKHVANVQLWLINASDNKLLIRNIRVTLKDGHGREVACSSKYTPSTIYAGHNWYDDYNISVPQEATVFPMNAGIIDVKIELPDGIQIHISDVQQSIPKNGHYERT